MNRIARIAATAVLTVTAFAAVGAGTATVDALDGSRTAVNASAPNTDWPVAPANATPANTDWPVAPANATPANTDWPVAPADGLPAIAQV